MRDGAPGQAFSRRPHLPELLEHRFLILCSNPTPVSVSQISAIPSPGRLEAAMPQIGDHVHSERDRAALVGPRTEGLRPRRSRTFQEMAAGRERPKPVGPTPANLAQGMLYEE